jgi:hypothetical protein
MLLDVAQLQQAQSKAKASCARADKKMMRRRAERM